MGLMNKLLNGYDLAYEGSVKKVLVSANAKPSNGAMGLGRFVFTNKYSVFDFGDMGHEFSSKSHSIAFLTAYVYELFGNRHFWHDLQKSNVWQTFKSEEFVNKLKTSKEMEHLLAYAMRTTYKGIVDSKGDVAKTEQLGEISNMLQVDIAQVVHPNRVNGRYDYSGYGNIENNFLIPIEVIFRNGTPEGCSPLKNYAKAKKADDGKGMEKVMKDLGIDYEPRVNDWLPKPVINYTTKLEDEDRRLSIEEAYEISNLKKFTSPNAPLENVWNFAQLLNIGLFSIFKDAGLELWDGKFEFVWHSLLALGDAMSPDEIRAMRLVGDKRAHLSKEMTRWDYTGTPWEKEWTFCKEQAKKTGEDPMDVYLGRGNPRFPLQLPDERLRMIDLMYPAITFAVTKNDLYKSAPSIEEIASADLKWRESDKKQQWLSREWKEWSGKSGD